MVKKWSKSGHFLSFRCQNCGRHRSKFLKKPSEHDISVSVKETSKNHWKSWLSDIFRVFLSSQPLVSTRCWQWCLSVKTSWLFSHGNFSGWLAKFRTFLAVLSKSAKQPISDISIILDIFDISPGIGSLLAVLLAVLSERKHEKPVFLEVFRAIFYQKCLNLVFFRVFTKKHYWHRVCCVEQFVRKTAKREPVCDILSKL